MCYRIFGGSLRRIQTSGDNCFDSECRVPPLAAAHPPPGDARGDAVGIRHAASAH